MPRQVPVQIYSGFTRIIPCGNARLFFTQVRWKADDSPGYSDAPLRLINKRSGELNSPLMRRARVLFSIVCNGQQVFGRGCTENVLLDNGDGLPLNPPDKMGGDIG